MKNLLILNRQFLFYFLFTMILSSPVFADRPLPPTIIGKIGPGRCETGTITYTINCGPGTNYLAACVWKTSASLTPNINFRLQASRSRLTYLSGVKIDSTDDNNQCSANVASLKEGPGVYYLNVWTTVCGRASFSGTVGCYDSHNIFTSTTVTVK